MHPILSRGRLLIYLAAWIPIGGLLAVLVGLVNRRAWYEALALALPLALLYAFMCLGSWSLCRALPLGRTGVGRIAVGHGFAAAVSSALWTAIGRGWAVVLGWLLDDAQTAPRYDIDIPIFFGAGMLLFALASAVHYLLIAFEASRAAETRALELQVLARDAQLETLQAQVNPHFLFNSLNAISSLTGSDPPAARRMCLLLAAFLRRSLSLGARRQIHLEEEMSLVDDFLAIETVRFGPRLRVDRTVEPGAERFLLPPLVLQPLIENAVNHGIATRIEGGTVSIAARIDAGLLVVKVENPFDPDSRTTRGQGLGIANVRARLAAIHGSTARLAVASTGGTFRVDLSLPAITDPEDSLGRRHDEVSDVHLQLPSAEEARVAPRGTVGSPSSRPTETHLSGDIEDQAGSSGPRSEPAAEHPRDTARKDPHGA